MLSKCGMQNLKLESKKLNIKQNRLRDNRELTSGKQWGEGKIGVED